MREKRGGKKSCWGNNEADTELIIGGSTLMADDATQLQSAVSKTCYRSIA